MQPGNALTTRGSKQVSVSFMLCTTAAVKVPCELFLDILSPIKLRVPLKMVHVSFSNHSQPLTLWQADVVFTLNASLDNGDILNAEYVFLLSKFKNEFIPESIFTNAYPRIERIWPALEPNIVFHCNLTLFVVEASELEFTLVNEIDPKAAVGVFIEYVVETLSKSSISSASFGNSFVLLDNGLRSVLPLITSELKEVQKLLIDRTLQVLHNMKGLHITDDSFRSFRFFVRAVIAVTFAPKGPFPVNYLTWKEVAKNTQKQLSWNLQNITDELRAINPIYSVASSRATLSASHHYDLMLQIVAIIVEVAIEQDLANAPTLDSLCSLSHLLTSFPIEFFGNMEHPIRLLCNFLSKGNINFGSDEQTFKNFVDALPKNLSLDVRAILIVAAAPTLMTMTHGLIANPSLQLAQLVEIRTKIFVANVASLEATETWLLAVEGMPHGYSITMALVSHLSCLFKRASFQSETKLSMFLPRLIQQIQLRLAEENNAEAMKILQTSLSDARAPLLRYFPLTIVFEPSMKSYAHKMWLQWLTTCINQCYCCIDVDTVKCRAFLLEVAKVLTMWLTPNDSQSSQVETWRVSWAESNVTEICGILVIHASFEDILQHIDIFNTSTGQIQPAWQLLLDCALELALKHSCNLDSFRKVIVSLCSSNGDSSTLRITSIAKANVLAKLLTKMPISSSHQLDTLSSDLWDSLLLAISNFGDLAEYQSIYKTMLTSRPILELLKFCGNILNELAAERLTVTFFKDVQSRPFSVSILTLLYEQRNFANLAHVELTLPANEFVSTLVEKYEQMIITVDNYLTVSNSLYQVCRSHTPAESVAHSKFKDLECDMINIRQAFSSWPLSKVVCAANNIRAITPNELILDSNSLFAHLRFVKFSQLLLPWLKSSIFLPELNQRLLVAQNANPMHAATCAQSCDIWLESFFLVVLRETEACIAEMVNPASVGSLPLRGTIKRLGEVKGKVKQECAIIATAIPTASINIETISQIWEQLLMVDLWTHRADHLQSVLDLFAMESSKNYPSKLSQSTLQPYNFERISQTTMSNASGHEDFYPSPKHNTSIVSLEDSFSNLHALGDSFELSPSFASEHFFDGDRPKATSTPPPREPDYNQFHLDCIRLSAIASSEDSVIAVGLQASSLVEENSDFIFQNSDAEHSYKLIEALAKSRDLVDILNHHDDAALLVAADPTEFVDTQVVHKFVKARQQLQPLLDLDNMNRDSGKVVKVILDTVKQCERQLDKQIQECIAETSTLERRLAAFNRSKSSREEMRLLKESGVFIVKLFAEDMDYSFEAEYLPALEPSFAYGITTITSISATVKATNNLNDIDSGSSSSVFVKAAESNMDTDATAGEHDSSFSDVSRQAEEHSLSEGQPGQSKSSQSQKHKKLTRQQLEELRGRALIGKNADESSWSPFTDAASFVIEMVNACDELVVLLRYLHSLGFPLSNDFKTIAAKDSDTLLKIAKHLEEQRVHFDTAWRNAAINHPSVRLFHPRELLPIESLMGLPRLERRNVMIKPETASNSTILEGVASLIAAVHPAAFSNLVQSLGSDHIPHIYHDDQSTFEYRFEQLGRTLGLLFDSFDPWPSTNFTQVLSSPSFSAAAAAGELPAEIEPGSAHLALVQKRENIPNAILAIFLVHHMLPSKTRLLICSRDTDWPTLEVFVYHALLSSVNSVSQDNATFVIKPVSVIVFPESLDLDMQMRLLALIDEVVTSKRTAQSDASSLSISRLENDNNAGLQLGRICFLSWQNHVSEPLSHSLIHRSVVSPLPLALFQDTLRFCFANICVITSSRAGMGKTYFARQKAREKKMELSTVAISGDMGLSSVLRTLSAAAPESENVLHLTLTDVADPSVAELLLLQLLVVRVVIKPQSSLPIPIRQDTIFVELSSSTDTTDPKVMFPFLTSFTHVHLTGDPTMLAGGGDNFFRFDIPDNYAHPIRLVCAYLYLLEKKQVGTAQLSLDMTEPHPSQKLPAEECRKLLKRHFFASFTSPDAKPYSYIVLMVFIKVLAVQLSRFSVNVFLQPKQMSFLDGQSPWAYYFFGPSEKALMMRTMFVHNTVELCRNFAVQSLSFTNHQDLHVSMAKKLKDLRATPLEVMVHLTENMVTWTKSNPTMIILNRDDHSLTFIVRSSSEMSAEAKFLLQGQPDDLREFILENASQIKLRELVKCLIGATAGTVIPFDTKKYVLCHDNVVKMALIMLRIDACVPVVLLGETGCGKTSLLQFLGKTVGAEVVTLSMNAGTTIEKLEGAVRDATKLCEANNNNEKQVWLFLDEINTSPVVGVVSELICHRMLNGDPIHQNLVVIGACNPYRLRPVGTTLTTGLRHSRRVTEDIQSRLVYRVFPLPHNLIEYAWDYGMLSAADEEAFIQQMAATQLPEDFPTSRFAALLVIAQEFIRFHQSAIAVSLRDVSRCLSLTTWFIGNLACRYVHRSSSMSTSNKYSRAAALALTVVYRSRLNDATLRQNLFLKLQSGWSAPSHVVTALKLRKESNETPGSLVNQESSRLNASRAPDSIDSRRRAAPIRIPSASSTVMDEHDEENSFAPVPDDLESEHLIDHNQSFVQTPPFSESSEWQVFQGRIDKHVNEEEEAYWDAMVHESNVASTRSLREMIFVTLVCIFNRIPIFIIGDPGCGKSLSMSIISVSCLGENSTHPFLRDKPILSFFSHQGSNSARSEGILSIFENAEQCVRPSVQPVVLLDEVGNNDQSPHNPLNVLHNLLEPSTGTRPNVSVVGISNFALDPAKMSRVIHLSRPRLSFVDIQETAETILKAEINRRLNENEQDILKQLVRKYTDFLKYHKDDFHGLRDFYALIKHLAVVVKQTRGSTLKAESFFMSPEFLLMLQRNFGGRPSIASDRPGYLPASFAPFISTKEQITLTRDLIVANLSDPGARHLMLIVSGDGGMGLAAHVIKLASRNIHANHLPPRVFYASTFAEDISDDYMYRTLSEIILCMDSGRTVVLMGPHRIFPALYDLLNQKYIRPGHLRRRRHCRVALGASENRFCFVHPSFRCVVVLTEAEVNEADLPFLNRFEKLRLGYDCLFDERSWREQDTLMQNVKSMSTAADASDVNWPLTASSLIPGFGDDGETVASIILSPTSTSRSDSFSNVCIADFENRLFELATCDGMICASRSVLAQQQPALVKRIQSYYFRNGLHDGLKSCVLQSLSQRTTTSLPLRLVVLTFTSALQSVASTLESLPDMKGWSARDNVLRLNSIRNERELIKLLRAFVRDSNSHLFVIQVDMQSEAAHFYHSLSVVEEETRSEINKHVVFILHLFYSSESQKLRLITASGWTYVMVDSLVPSSLDPPISRCVGSTLVNIVSKDGPLPLQSLLPDAIFVAIEWLFPAEELYRDKPQQLYSAVINHKRLIDVISELVYQAFTEIDKKCEQKMRNWLVDLACDQQSIYDLANQLDFLGSSSTNVKFSFSQNRHGYESLGNRVLNLVKTFTRRVVGETLQLLHGWDGLEMLLKVGKLAPTDALEDFWLECVQTGMAFPGQVPNTTLPEGIRYAIAPPPSFPFARYWLSYLIKHRREDFLTELSKADQTDRDQLPVEDTQQDNVEDDEVAQAARERACELVRNMTRQSLSQDLDLIFRPLNGQASAIADANTRLTGFLVDDYANYLNVVCLADSSLLIPDSDTTMLLLQIVETALIVGAFVRKDLPVAFALVRLWEHEQEVKEWVNVLLECLCVTLLDANSPPSPQQIKTANETLENISRVLRVCEMDDTGANSAARQAAAAFLDELIRVVVEKRIAIIKEKVPMTKITAENACAAVAQEISLLVRRLPANGSIGASKLLTLKIIQDFLKFWAQVVQLNAPVSTLKEFFLHVQESGLGPVHLWSYVLAAVDSLPQFDIAGLRLTATFIQRTVELPEANVKSYVKHLAKVSRGLTYDQGQQFHLFVWSINSLVRRFLMPKTVVALSCAIDITLVEDFNEVVSAFAVALDKEPLLDDSHLAVALTDAVINISLREWEDSHTLLLSSGTFAAAVKTLTNFTSLSKRKQRPKAISAAMAAAVIYCVLEQLSNETVARESRAVAFKAVNDALQFHTEEGTLQAIFVLLIKQIKKDDNMNTLRKQLDKLAIDFPFLEVIKTVRIEAPSTNNKPPSGMLKMVESLSRSMPSSVLLSTASKISYSWPLSLFTQRNEPTSTRPRASSSHDPFQSLRELVGHRAITELGWHPLAEAIVDVEPWNAFVEWSTCNDMDLLSSVVDKAYGDLTLLKSLITFVASLVELGSVVGSNLHPKVVNFVALLRRKLSEIDVTTTDPNQQSQRMLTRMLRNLSNPEKLLSNGYNWGPRDGEGVLIQSLVLRYSIELSVIPEDQSVFAALASNPKLAISQFIPALLGSAAQAGWVQDSPQQQIVVPRKSMVETSYLLIHQAVFAALLGGYLWIHNDQIKLREFVNQDLTSVDAFVKFCIDHITNDYRLLKQSKKYSIDDAATLIFSSVKPICSVLMNAKTPEQRTELEKRLSQALRQKTERMQQFKVDAENAMKKLVTENDLDRGQLDIMEEISEDWKRVASSEYRRRQLPRLLRMRPVLVAETTPDLIQCLRSAFEINTSASKDLPFLALLLQTWDSLQYVENIVPLVRFSNMVRARLRHVITRTDAANMTFADFMRQFAGKDPKKRLREAHKAFIQSWNGFIESSSKDDQVTVKFDNEEIVISKISDKSNIALAFCEPDGVSKILCALIATLAERQNSFVQQAHTLADSQGGALSYLKGRPIRFVPVRSLLEADIIHIQSEEFHRTFAYSFPDLDIRHIKTTFFMYEKIEMELCQIFLGQRPSIRVDKHEDFAPFPYRGEIFKISVLTEKVRKVVPQVPLSEDAETQLSDHLASFSQNSQHQEFLDSLSLILLQASRHHPKPVQKLVDFAKATLPRRDQETFQNQPELCNLTMATILHVFELAELAFGWILINNLTKEFCVSLDSQAISHIEKCLADPDFNHIERNCKALDRALKRLFYRRFLHIDEVKPDDPIQLKDVELWISSQRGSIAEASLLANQFMKRFEPLEKVVTLSQIQALSKLANQMLDRARKERSATGTAHRGQAAFAQSSRPGTTKTKQYKTPPNLT